MFYNTENFFDPYDDTLTADDEFTPRGDRHWTYDRFVRKANRLYKVFVAAGGWVPPAIIGLAEIENEYVLHYLVSETPFSKFNYQYVHYDSPDVRGIDVAMLFDPGVIKILRSAPITVHLPSGRPTRDILYVIVSLPETPVHIFINHWPSRRSGYLETNFLRMAAARTLKFSLDTLTDRHPDARIIVMGDFNDEPGDESLLMLCRPDTGQGKYAGLVNLMSDDDLRDKGTLFYQDRWWLFDQFLVSENLTGDGRKIKVSYGTPRIYNAGFLLTHDEKNIPYRTFQGYKYAEGFSDHLPVLLKLDVEK